MHPGKHQDSRVQNTRLNLYQFSEGRSGYYSAPGSACTSSSTLNTLKPLRLGRVPQFLDGIPARVSPGCFTSTPSPSTLQQLPGIGLPEIPLARSVLSIFPGCIVTRGPSKFHRETPGISPKASKVPGDVPPDSNTSGVAFPDLLSD